MSNIPGSINGVSIEFAENVNRSVDQKVFDLLKHVLSPEVASGYILEKVYISSANDQHVFPSRHVQGEGKAVDISRINGLKMSVSYSSDQAVRAITDALQNRAESYVHIRENFGPLFKKKLGEPHHVSGHKDHIHFSVN
ncbi:hypothetical protein MLC59_06060 [Marinobacter bryozoorum]|uniref:hypothetical protein n=1 Tax=Marinobacter bryozoorum TaxID=256324 RepID=UPI0020037F81|nr:hypothetical protein [Marinobacter bryozoorum]MCK7543731.1 hypothetical protein [Marinobacter bryozoorum]